MAKLAEAVVPTDAAIERIVAFIKARLEKAVQNGQRVRMDVNDHASTGRLSERVTQGKSLTDLMTAYCEPTGGAEIHIYIETKR